MTSTLICSTDPEGDIKALYMETKRCILYIIRVQTGANLMDIMVKQPTVEDEERWMTLVRDELSTHNTPRSHMPRPILWLISDQ